MPHRQLVKLQAAKIVCWMVTALTYGSDCGEDIVTTQEMTQASTEFVEDTAGLRVRMICTPRPLSQQL